MECHPKKIKNMKDVNDDDLVLSSSVVVLEVKERELFLQNYIGYNGNNI